MTQFKLINPQHYTGYAKTRKRITPSKYMALSVNENLYAQVVAPTLGEVDFGGFLIETGFYFVNK